MPQISVTQKVYDRIKAKTTKHKPYHPDKISFSDVVEAALDIQETIEKGVN